MDDLGRVDVWLACLDDVTDDQRAVCAQVLCRNELERLRRFRVDDAALQYLVGRFLVRTTLSHYVQTDPAHWRFVTNAHGRPRIDGPGADLLTFNLSHTRGLVACAVARRGEGEVELGIDVECAQRAAEIESVGHDILAPEEMAQLSAAPREGRADMLLSFWTLKEAYVKARGVGLSLPLTSFAFDLSGPGPRVSFAERGFDEAARWTFLQLRPTLNHHVALAISCAEPVETAWRWVDISSGAGGALPLLASPRCIYLERE